MAVLTSVGRQWIIDKMRDTVATQQKFIHWGTGTTGELVGQTALVTPAAEARTIGVISSPSAALHRVIGTLTAASAKNISEVGLFDASAAGVMLIRAVFTAIPVEIGDSVQFTLDLTQS